MSVCDSWGAVSTVIPAADFVGWGAEGIKKNCYSYCVAQLAKAGYKLASPGWVIGTGLVYQTYVSEKIKKLEPGFQVSEFELGVEYTKLALSSGIPVMFGVDDAAGSPNADKVTDHFVTVVGMGTDTTGNYFLFYDNATSVAVVGTSNANRIYVNCTDSSLIGNADSANSYATNSSYGNYTVTQIRRSVKAT
jgi:hypothetical protein